MESKLENNQYKTVDELAGDAQLSEWMGVHRCSPSLSRMQISYLSLCLSSLILPPLTPVFDNCKAYNPRNSPYAKCADKLEKFFKENLPMVSEKARRRRVCVTTVKLTM